ncbi:MAG: hypothetical protein IJS41_03830 [Clostridia bacterium]|nr:hypothetical protein [Clostridia bacterium]
MTFKNLQDDLIEDIKKTLKDMVTKDRAGNDIAGFNGYAHALPVLQDDEEDPDRFFPFFIVRYDTITTAGDDDCWHATLDIILGVHDRTGYLGHEHLLVAIQRILDRFVSDPKLAGKYRADQNPTATVGEDDTFPYYYGAVQITFSAPKMGRSKDYYA